MMKFVFVISIFVLAENLKKNKQLKEETSQLKERIILLESKLKEEKSIRRIVQQNLTDIKAELLKTDDESCESSKNMISCCCKCSNVKCIL